MKTSSKHFSLGLAVCFLLWQGLSNGQAAAQYTITDLGSAVFAQAINNNGQIAGVSSGHAFIYSGGTMRNLGTLGGVQAINDSGQVVGYGAVSGDFRQHAFLYSGGSMQDLGAGAANDINNQGQFTGVGANSHAFLYSGGTMHDLGTLGGTISSGYGLNDSGQVVGASTTSANDQHAFLYSGGSMTDLGALLGGTGSAAAINNNGQIAGWFSPAQGQVHLFLYSGTMKDLGLLTGYPGIETVSMNNNGQIITSVGMGYTSFLYNGGSLQNLNDLIDPSSGWTELQAKGINDLGQIVGFGQKGGAWEGFLLTPVPEPATWALMVLGGVVLLGIRRLRRSH